MAFQQGLSGLNASSRNLEVIGNNVANANTYGAKTARAEFADMYANSMSGAGTQQAGIGVRVAAVAQQFTQGNITTTSNPLDLAINGNGFFVVANGDQQLYTRNGQFKIDRDGYIVNNQGHQLQAYALDASGNPVGGDPGPVQLPTGGVAPQQTSTIAMEATLDSRAGVRPTTPLASGAPIDFNDASTYNNATSQTVYDTKGQPVTLTYYFQKTGADAWSVYATANGQNVPTAATPTPIATLQFPSTGGNPSDINGGGANNVFTLPTIPGVTLTTGGTSEPISGVQVDLRQISEYGSAFGVTNPKQNGYAPGQLTGISIDASGVMLARYSNGQTKPTAQLAIANFTNVQGLQPMGGNEWTMTYTSGDPIVGVPGSGNFGVLQAGALEDSNVDLTGELVNMIVAQRAYQANAQTIKTEDQVMQTLVNLR